MCMDYRVKRMPTEDESQTKHSMKKGGAHWPSG